MTTGTDFARTESERLAFAVTEKLMDEVLGRELSDEEWETISETLEVAIYDGIIDALAGL